MKLRTDRKLWSEIKREQRLYANSKSVKISRQNGTNYKERTRGDKEE